MPTVCIPFSSGYFIFQPNVSLNIIFILCEKYWGTGDFLHKSGDSQEFGGTYSKGRLARAQ